MWSIEKGEETKIQTYLDKFIAKGLKQKSNRVRITFLKQSIDSGQATQVNNKALAHFQQMLSRLAEQPCQKANEYNNTLNEPAHYDKNIGVVEPTHSQKTLNTSTSPDAYEIIDRYKNKQEEPPFPKHVLIADALHLSKKESITVTEVMKYLYANFPFYNNDTQLLVRLTSVLYIYAN